VATPPPDDPVEELEQELTTAQSTAESDGSRIA
jgi:hypothetical protein